MSITISRIVFRRLPAPPRPPCGATASADSSDDRAQAPEGSGLAERRSARRNRPAAASRRSGICAARIAAKRCSVMPGRRITRCALQPRRRGDDEHVSQRRSPAGLEQQRDVEHHQPRAARRGRATKRRSARAHQRMQDRFQPAQLRRVAENARPSAARSMPPASLRTPGKRRLDGRDRGAARRQQPMHRGVGVVQRHAEPPQHRRGGALAHADRAGQAEDDHRPDPSEVVSTAARSAGVTCDRGAEPGLEPGRALMQQHAEPVDRPVAAPPRRRQQRAFRAAHRRCRRRRRRRRQSAQIDSSAGSPVMPRLVVLTSRPASSQRRVARSSHGGPDRGRRRRQDRARQLRARASVRLTRRISATPASISAATTARAAPPAPSTTAGPAGGSQSGSALPQVFAKAEGVGIARLRECRRPRR